MSALCSDFKSTGQRPEKKKSRRDEAATGGAFAGELLRSNRLQADATLNVGKSRRVRARFWAPEAAYLAMSLRCNRLQAPLGLFATRARSTTAAGAS